MRRWDHWEVTWIERRLGALPGLLALEVGAGDGRFLGALQARGVWGMGVDAHPRHPAVYEAVFPNLHPLVQVPVELLCCREILYYLPWPDSLRRLWGLLLPGGWVHVKSTVGPPEGNWTHCPNRDQYERTFLEAGFWPVVSRWYPGRWRYRHQRFVLLARRGGR